VVLVAGHAVRLAVVLGSHVKLSTRADPENTAEGEIDGVEIAFAVERRPLQEAAGGRRTLARGEPLGRRRAFAQLRRHFGEHLGLDALRRREQAHRHSALMPTSRATLDHFTSSAEMKPPNSAL